LDHPAQSQAQSQIQAQVLLWPQGLDQVHAHSQKHWSWHRSPSRPLQRCNRPGLRPQPVGPMASWRICSPPSAARRQPSGLGPAASPLPPAGAPGSRAPWPMPATSRPCRSTCALPWSMCRPGFAAPTRCGPMAAGGLLTSSSICCSGPAPLSAMEGPRPGMSSLGVRRRSAPHL
jgi:hypothetical protein